MKISEEDCGASGTDHAAACVDKKIASKESGTIAHPPDTGISTSSSNQDVGDEEPNMAVEPDLPSDGRDVVGEAMIRDLTRRPPSSEPPSQPVPSTQQN